MSNLLTVVSAASDYGVTRKIVEEAIKLAQLEPTHTYPSGKGFAGLYEPEALKKAIDELTAAKARAKQEAEEASRTAKQQAGGLSVAQFQEVQGRLDDIVSRIDDVNKTMVEIQVAEDEVGDEYRTLAEQNRLTFKAITDLASATSSTFKELHAMMVAQVNRLSDVMVQVDAFMLSTKEQTAQTGADVKAILTLIREVSKPAPTAPAANQPISPAPPPRDILPPLPTPPAPAPAPAVKPAPAPIAVKTVTPSKVTPIAAPKQATKAAAVLPTPERLADMPVTAITQAFAEIGAKTPKVAKLAVIKPVIVVAGLVGTQQEEVRREFGGQLDLQMFEGGETIKKPFATACGKANWIFVLTKVSNNPLKQAVSAHKAKLTSVAGHTSAVKMELTKWLADRAAQAAKAA